MRLRSRSWRPPLDCPEPTPEPRPDDNRSMAIERPALEVQRREGPSGSPNRDCWNRHSGGGRRGARGQHDREPGAAGARPELERAAEARDVVARQREAEARALADRLAGDERAQPKRPG